MIKAKINSTGEVVNVRPYQTEIYDFMACRNGGIMGELYMRSELIIIGDNELDFVSLVRKMRDVQKEYDDAIDKVYSTHAWVGDNIPYEVHELLRKLTKKKKALQKEVDEYLKKMEELK